MFESPIKPLTAEQEAIAKTDTAKEGYIRRALVALDIFLNVIFGGNEDETMSSRLARWSKLVKPGRTGKLKKDIPAYTGWVTRKSFGWALSTILCWFQPNHGAEAEAGDLERAEAAEEIEMGTKNLPTK